MGEERPPTQIIMAKVIKASKQLKQAFFNSCSWTAYPKGGVWKVSIGREKGNFFKTQE